MTCNREVYEKLVRYTKVLGELFVSSTHSLEIFVLHKDRRGAKNFLDGGVTIVQLGSFAYQTIAAFGRRYRHNTEGEHDSSLQSR
jgi:hypothetical protein